MEENERIIMTGKRSNDVSLIWISKGEGRANAEREQEEQFLFVLHITNRFEIEMIWKEQINISLLTDLEREVANKLEFGFVRER